MMMGKNGQLNGWGYALIMSFIAVAIAGIVIFFATKGDRVAIFFSGLLTGLAILSFGQILSIAQAWIHGKQEQSRFRDNHAENMDNLNQVSKTMMNQHRVLERQVRQGQLQAGNEPDFGNVSLFEEGIFNELESGEQGE
jgi:hypothetical protein